jgi:hypothetical protein
MKTSNYKFLVSSLALGASIVFSAMPAYAKLPSPSAEAKVKAEEAKVKAAENAKKEFELLAKYQDSVAEKYSAKLKSEGKEFKPTVIPAPVVAAAPAPAASAVTAPSAPVAPAVPAVAPKK